MSEAKHTPGPWDKIIHAEGSSRVGANTLIAVVYSERFRDRENQEANARLIAAAPDLLEALIGLTALTEKMFGMLRESAARGLTTMTPNLTDPRDLKFVDASHKAIAKAEGRA